MDEFARARWEGGMETRVADAERRLDAINGSIGAHASAVNDLALKLGALGVRVGIYSGIGSLTAGAVITAALKFLQ